MLKGSKIIVVGSYTRSLYRFRGIMLKEMRDKGNEVIAVSPEIDPESIEQLKSWGIEFIQSPLNRTAINPFKDSRYLFWLNKLIKTEKPDKVFLYTIKPVIYGGIACRISKRTDYYPMISGLGFTQGSGSIKQGILRLTVSWLYKLALKDASTVFFQNQENKDVFIQQDLISPEKAVLTNGSGVDLNAYNFKAIPQDEPVKFLLIARLIKEKGIEDFAEACKILQKQNLAFKAVLIGPLGNHPNAITKQQVDAWEQEGAIEYKGYLKDVYPILTSSHVFVLPTYYKEGVPRTLLEALATGRPIITTDTAGCRETVNEGKNGFLIAPKNPEKLAQTMTYFIENKEDIERMGNSSRQLAEEKFDVRKVNDTIFEAMKL